REPAWTPPEPAPSAAAPPWSGPRTPPKRVPRRTPPESYYESAPAAPPSPGKLGSPQDALPHAALPRPVTPPRKAAKHASPKPPGRESDCPVRSPLCGPSLLIETHQLSLLQRICRWERWRLAGLLRPLVSACTWANGPAGRRRSQHQSSVLS